MAITLTPNAIYSALSNMIIGIRLFESKVATPKLSDLLKEEVGLYGDKKVYRSMDIGKSYKWEGDAEAARLLQVNRNKTQQEQVLTIDNYRQCNVTTDRYLSKQAWFDEGSFSSFNGELIASLGKTKRVYDEGYCRTFVGTANSDAEESHITIIKPTAGANDNTETVNRLTAQKIAKAIANLKVVMEDNTRSFNDYGFLNSYSLDDCIQVWNAEIYNDILYIDLPTMFHNENIKPMATLVLPARYFGDVIVGTATGNTATITTADGREVAGKGANGAVRTLIEQEIDGIHYFPGDALKTGAIGAAGTCYLQDSDTIIGKVFTKEAVPFLSAFSVGTAFNNPRSLTDTNFLTWGHANLELIKAQPFITLEFAS